MRRATRLATAAALISSALVAATGPALAAGSPSSEIAIADTDVSDDGTVTIELTTPAEPETADFVSSFSVTENGEPVDVRAEPIGDDPLTVVLVVDTSGSMAGEPLEAARAAALKFQDVVGADVPIGIVTAGRPTTVLAAPTTARTTTSKAIGALTASGETSLLDSLVVAASTLGPAPEGERRAVVLLTDGADTASMANEVLVTEMLRVSGAELIAIALDSPDQDLVALATLVDEVEGRLEVAPDETSLTSLYRSAAERLTNRWLLTFPSTSEFARSSINITLPVGDETYTVSTNVEISEAIRAIPDPITPQAPSVYVEQVPGGIQNAAFAPWAAGVAVMMALGLIAWAVAPRARPERRLAVEDGVLPETDGLTGLRHRLGAVGTAIVDRAGYTSRLDHLLDQSGIALSAGEAVAATGATALLSAAVGALIGGGIGAVLATAFCILIAVAAPARARSVRRRRFADQLADTLTMLAGSLRAGNGVGGAIDAVAAESPSPMADELARATLEARLGRPLTAALNGVAERMQSRDFTWVVEAIDVQREVGGNLAQVLERVSTTIRSRQRLRRQVQAATAEGRLSAMVLIALPVGITGILSATNPEYMQPLFTETRGQIILGIAVTLLLAGGLLLKRLVEPDL